MVSIHVNLVIKIKAAYKEWKDSRFLKKHGCDNWGQYAHRYDTDVNYRSSRVPDYFMGYEYVHCITKQSHYAYTELYDHGPGGYRYGYHEMTDWCKANIKNKHRTDILRVIHTDYEGW